MTRAARVMGAAVAIGVAVSPDLAWRTPARSARSALDRYALDAAPAFRMSLPSSLREVSGLAVTPDGRVLAVNDEQAVVYEVDYRRGRITKSFALGPEAVGGDFEGLAVAEGRIFLVTSRGELYESAEGRNGQRVTHGSRDTGLGRLCEIEGLAYEASSKSFLFACKTTRARALRRSVAILRWTLEGGRVKGGDVVTPTGEIARAMHTRAFHPSGVERDPETGHYVLVSAVERAVVELSPAGKVVAVRSLPDAAGERPEGIAFGQDLSLIVASEGRRGAATLAVYARVR